MGVPTQAAGALLPRFLLRIGGKAVEPSSGEYFQSENPYTGEPWCEVARGTAADVDKAVTAAKIAQKQWAATLPGERAMRLLRLADIVDKNVSHLAELDCRDNGKTIAEMTHATRAIVDWLRYFAGLADKLQGDVLPQEREGYFNYTRHDPLGIIGVITPWNSPITLMTMKVAPALAAGNAVVVKPSEFTSAATTEFADLFVEAGFPAGLVNVVTGFGAEAGAALVQHPDIAKIAFTGSDQGGQRIYESAARGVKQVLLELGGKSANIVFGDANLEAAAMGALGGIFTAGGQTCIAGSRLLVQRSIHDELIGRMLEVLQTAKLGDPMDPATNIGPIANPPQYEKVLKYIDIAKSEGAICVAGGRPSDAGKYFIEPTIFTGVNNKMRIAQEEVFGPILSVIPFEDDEEAYAIANDTPYGLAAGVWTSDIGRAMAAPRRLQVGHVWINTYRIGGHTMPFGGVKRSGIGREGGVDALKEFTSVKTVVMGLNANLINPFAMR